MRVLSSTQSKYYTTKKTIGIFSPIEQSINNLKENNVNNTQLNYSEIERLQFLLRMHLLEYKNVMPESMINNLEALQTKLIVMRAKLEKVKIKN